MISDSGLTVTKRSLVKLSQVYSAIDSIAASVVSSTDLLECPVRTVTPANEGQCALGLVVQPVALGALRGLEDFA